VGSSLLGVWVLACSQLMVVFVDLVVEFPHSLLSRGGSLNKHKPHSSLGDPMVKHDCTLVILRHHKARNTFTPIGTSPQFEPDLPLALL